MTDPQQLRAIVAAWWKDTFVDTDCVIDRSGNYRSAEDCIEDIVVRARAALADGPAVPQGREPGAADLEKEFRYWWKEAHGSPYFGAVPLVAVLSWTEYALARWGNPAPAPAGVLASRVAQSLAAVFQNGPYAEGSNRWDEQAASAAIREVAKWLAEQDYTGTSATPGDIAEWLRQELENNG